MTFSPDDIEVLAQTIYGEARGEEWAGKIAVAWIVKTRWIKEWRGAASIAEVCKQAWQFSCWNKSDPNREKMERLSTLNSRFQTCLAAAAAVLSGMEPDPTNGATHYLTYAAYREHQQASERGPRSWSKGLEPVARIGGHLFFVAS